MSLCYRNTHVSGNAEALLGLRRLVEQKCGQRSKKEVENADLSLLVGFLVPKLLRYTLPGSYSNSACGIYLRFLGQSLALIHPDFGCVFKLICCNISRSSPRSLESEANTAFWQASPSMEQLRSVYAPVWSSTNVYNTYHDIHCI